MFPKLYAAAAWLLNSNVLDLARTFSVSPKGQIHDVSRKPVVRTLQRVDDKTVVETMQGTVSVSPKGQIYDLSPKSVVRTLQRADDKALVKTMQRTASVSANDQIHDGGRKPVVRTRQRMDHKTVSVSDNGDVYDMSRKPVVRTLQLADDKTEVKAIQHLSLSNVDTAEPKHASAPGHERQWFGSIPLSDDPLQGKGSEAATAKSVARGELGTSNGTASRRASTEPALDLLGQASKHEQRPKQRTSSMLHNAVLVAFCGLVFGFLLAVILVSGRLGGQHAPSGFQRAVDLLGAASQASQPTSPSASNIRTRSVIAQVNRRVSNTSFVPQESRDIANAGDLVRDIVRLKENAPFKGKMWKLDQDCELDDDRNDWRERAVWISKPGHVYYFSDQQTRDQRFFDQAARDLRVVELHSEGMIRFFKYYVRVEDNVQNKHVYLATDSNAVMTKFLEVLRAGGCR